MRLLRQIIIIGLVILAAGTTGSAQSKDQTRLSIAKDVTDEIAHGQFASFAEHCSAELKESFPQDKLKKTMEDLTAVVGPFQKQLSQDARTVDGEPIYVSRSQFEKFKVELGLEFDDTNQVTHFWIAPVSDLTQENMEASAKTITNLLGQEQFDALSAQFNDQLKAMMSAEHLDESWSHVLHHLGKFKAINRAEKNPEYDIVDVRCEFEHGEIIVRVAFDLYGKVGFIWMLPLTEVEPPSGTAELLIQEFGTRN
jgi:hypothetical protein